MAGDTEQWRGSGDGLGKINRTWIVQCQEESGVSPASALGDSGEGDADRRVGEKMGKPYVSMQTLFRGY